MHHHHRHDDDDEMVYPLVWADEWGLKVLMIMIMMNIIMIMMNIMMMKSGTV